MDIAALILAKINEYSFAVHKYGTEKEWKFNEYIDFPGTKTSLFSTDINIHIRKHNGRNKELIFLCFHANRFNPTENNLFMVLFEVMDRVMHKGHEVILARFIYKSYIIKSLPFIGLQKESVFSPANKFLHNLLIVDRELAGASMDELIVASVDIKETLKKNIETLSLFYLWERITGENGTLDSFCNHLFLKNRIDIDLVISNADHFPVLLFNRNLETTGYDYNMAEEITEKFSKLELDVRYSYVNHRYSRRLTSVVLSPVINEVYLKATQEYYYESEWPFISVDLLSNIRNTNKNRIMLSPC